MRHYKVSEVNEILKIAINENYLFKNIGIIGEISQINIRKNYAYIDLVEKIDDRHHTFSVFIEKKLVEKKFDLITQNKSLVGKLIRVEGDLTYFSGSIQLKAKNFIVEESEGEYKLRITKLREEYKAKGYFDESRKKRVPIILINVALITTHDGAAIKDIKNNTHNKYCKIDILYTKVQGIGAAEEIAKNIKMLDSVGYDAIIIARGGGSTQDLRIFDSENIVEAVYSAKTPIITAIGHEKDRFLVDDVADVSKGTPSIVATEVIKSDEDIERLFEGCKRNLVDKIKDRIDKYSSKLININKELADLSLDNKLLRKIKDIEKIDLVLDTNINNVLIRNKEKLRELVSIIDKFSPSLRISEFKNEIAKLNNLLYKEINEKLNTTKSQFKDLINEFESNSPIRNMKNGRFISIKDNKVIKSSKELEIGDEFQLYSKDEILTVIVKSRCKNNIINEE